MLWINLKDHHIKVIKVPSSIMNSTINKAGGRLLWGGWTEEKTAEGEVLCITTLVYCCENDYDERDDDGDGSS